MLHRLSTSQAGFDDKLAALTAWQETVSEQVVSAVDTIVDDVRQQGDNAVLAYSEKFDGLRVSSVAELELSPQRLHTALQSLSSTDREALEFAAKRIDAFHRHQFQQSWEYRDDLGNLLGQRILPMQRVGIYVPGGKASYPSSVLMNALPAKVAGVEEIIMTVPTPDGEINEMVLAAAAIAGVDRVFTIGGAQAIAALAYGTETIPGVDKIVGPGNIYVATAKRKVFGQVGIDMVAGPSEVVIIADGTASPDWMAMDMFAQAEHDESAQSILLSDDADYLEQVADSLQRLLPEMTRADIIRQSLVNRGALIHTRSIEEAVAVSNKIAPEHLQLAVADPEALMQQVTSAGAVFLGINTTESLGDYCAGTNHVLPTSGGARFSSALGVYDFQKRSSIIHCSEQGVAALGRVASTMAHGESLEAHARSAEMRYEDR